MQKILCFPKNTIGWMQMKTFTDWLQSGKEWRRIQSESNVISTEKSNIRTRLRALIGSQIGAWSEEGIQQEVKLNRNAITTTFWAIVYDSSLARWI